jgi:ABC-2 type transport system permease protein
MTTQQSQTFALLGLHLRLMRAEPVLPIMLFAGPILLRAFIEPTLGPALEAGGFVSTLPSRYSVPGMTLMFSPLLINMVNYGFFRDAGWRTVARLMNSGVTKRQYLTVKLGFPLACGMGQIAIGLALASLRGSYRIQWQTFGTIAACLLLDVFWLSLGYFLVSRLRSLSVANSVTQLSLIFFSGLGGAIAPLPHSASGTLMTLRSFSPTHWAMKMSNHFEYGISSSISGVLFPIVVLGSSSIFLHRISGEGYEVDRRKYV